MSKHKKHKCRYRWFLSGQERGMYGLADCFVREKGRRMNPMLEDRCRINEDAPLRQPYPKITVKIVHACWGDHPAMRRYKLHKGVSF